MEAQKERREDFRVAVRESLAACIKADSETRLGILTDISRGGLAFRYVDFDYKPVSPGKTCRLTILNRDHEILVDKVQARIAYDRDATQEFSFSLLKMKKIGIEFDGLPKDYTILLESLLGSFQP